MIEYEILKYLKENYNEGHVELLDYFLEKYPDANIATLTHVNKALRYLAKENKFIDISDTSEIYSQLGSLRQFNVNGINENFDNFSFNDFKSIKERLIVTLAIPAKITLEGKKELDSYLMQEKISSVNQSVIDTNKSVRKSNFWTPVFAGLAALFSLISLAKGWKTSPLIEPRLQQTIEKQAQTLDSLQQTVKGIHSTFQQYVDSLKMTK